MTQQPQFTPEQAQEAQQQIQAALQEANLPAEMLAEIGRWAQQVITDPSKFPEFQAWLRSQGLTEEDIPEEPDFQELSSMVAIGHVAAGMQQQEVEPTTSQTGPVNPDQLQAMAGQGRMGDTMLAHINPQEAAVLKNMGGVGTINPATGLPEYGFFSDLWKGVKKVVKQVAPFVLPVVAIAFPALIPAIGTALGASAALAPVVGAAALAGGVTALSGGSIKQVLSSAALTGLGAYLTPIVGKYVGGLANITDPAITSAIGSATLAGGFTALRGGTVSQILTAAATGGAANYLGTVASNAINGGGITNTKITQKQFDDAVFAAADAKGLADAGLGKEQIAAVLTQSGLSNQVAQSAANLAKSGYTAEQIATGLSNTYGGSSIGGKKSLYVNGATGVEKSIIGGANVKALEAVQQAEDATFVAQDAQRLKASGLNQAAIEQNLRAQGVPPQVASMAASEAMRGATLDATAQSITYAANRSGGVIIAMPETSTSTPAPTPTPSQTQQGPTTVAEISPTGQTGPAQPQADASVAEVDISQPAASVAPPVNAPVGGNVSEAEFIAADAVQLAQQTKNAAAVQQNLEYAGVDPVVAAEAANLAVSGINAETIATAIGGMPGTSGAPAQGPSLFTNEPGAFTQQGSGQPPPTYFPPTGEGFTPPSTPPDYDVGAIAATPAIPNPLEPPEAPKRPDMGTFTPSSPDPSWSIPLQYPGMNPGLVGAGIRPAYQTTSPVQSQYYWGRQPFFATADDLSRYGTSPFQPTQPFGLQQAYFEQPASYQSSPVYGANLQPISPQQMPTAGQIGGSEPLTQPIPVQVPVTPYEVTPYANPAMVPYNMYQIPVQPSYVYNVAPSAAQYSVPTAAPMGVA